MVWWKTPLIYGNFLLLLLHRTRTRCGIYFSHAHTHARAQTHVCTMYNNILCVVTHRKTLRLLDCESHINKTKYEFYLLTFLRGGNFFLALCCREIRCCLLAFFCAPRFSAAECVDARVAAIFTNLAKIDLPGDHVFARRHLQKIEYLQKHVMKKFFRFVAYLS